MPTLQPGSPSVLEVLGLYTRARPATLATDVFSGLAISAPVYWAFTQFLAINLPGLTSTGWL